MIKFKNVKPGTVLLVIALPAVSVLVDKLSVVVFIVV